MSSKRKSRSLPLVLTATMFAMLAFAMPATAQHFPHAVGGGRYEEDGATSTFAFYALGRSNDRVSGDFVYDYRAGNLLIKMDIDCLRVIGNKAVMSGSVTSVRGSDPPPVLFVGARGIFQVEANSESPDRFSNLRLVPPTSDVTCRTFNPRLVFLIRGNILVRQ